MAYSAEKAFARFAVRPSELDQGLRGESVVATDAAVGEYPRYRVMLSLDSLKDIDSCLASCIACKVKPIGIEKWHHCVYDKRADSLSAEGHRSHGGSSSKIIATFPISANFYIKKGAC